MPASRNCLAGYIRPDFLLAEAFHACTHITSPEVRFDVLVRMAANHPHGNAELLLHEVAVAAGNIPDHGARIDLLEARCDRLGPLAPGNLLLRASEALLEHKANSNNLA